MPSMNFKTIIVKKYAFALFINMKKLKIINKIFEEIKCLMTQFLIESSNSILLFNKYKTIIMILLSNYLTLDSIVSNLFRKFLIILIKKIDYIHLNKFCFFQRTWSVVKIICT